MFLLTRYLLSQLPAYFFLGAGVVTFLLTMDFIYDYLDLFIGKGVSAWTVLKMFVLGLGWMLALSLPCGTLVSVLMTYGRMAQDNEITALRASGINLFRIIWPTLAASTLLAAGLGFFNDRILPETNHAFANLMVAVSKKKPTAQIQEGIFIDAFKGYNMFIGSLDDRSGQMQDILILDQTEGDENVRTILARHGTLHYDEKHHRLQLALRDGEVHEALEEDGQPAYRRLQFERQLLNIKDVDRTLKNPARRSRGQRELSIAAMKQEIRRIEEDRARYDKQLAHLLGLLGVASVHDVPGCEKRLPAPVAWVAAHLGLARPPSRPGLTDSVLTPENRRLIDDARLKNLQLRSVAKKINQYEVEIQKKISIPFACIVFTLIGAPLGIRARQGGLTVGFFSMAFFIFYYLCLVGGEQLADRALLPAWLSMWLANIVLGLLGVYMTLRVCEIGPRWIWRGSGRRPVVQRETEVQRETGQERRP